MVMITKAVMAMIIILYSKKSIPSQCFGFEPCLPGSTNITVAWELGVEILNVITFITS